MAKKNFQVTVSGTSHGEGVTTTILSCPKDLKLDLEFIDKALKLRRPGQTYTTPRNELDNFEILSGTNSKNTTNGEPLTIFIPNLNQNIKAYHKLHNVLRPGHGITMQLLKDPNVSQSGGGSASARLTAGFVAAWAISQLLLNKILEKEVEILSFISEMGKIAANVSKVTSAKIYNNNLRCPDPIAARNMEELLIKLISEGDSVGAIVKTIVRGYPGTIAERPGDSLDGQLAEAMLTINAVKGFIVGDMEPYKMLGSEYVDHIKDFEGKNLITYTNHGGGILGGMSMGGMPIITNTLFKPTSSIKKPIRTVDLNHNKQIIELSNEDRHDPCVAIRGVEVVKAMHRIVLCRALLSTQ